MKHFFESRIPPPVVVLIFAILTWIMKTITPNLTVIFQWHVILAVIICSLGILFEIAAILSFVKARTTVDPTHPHHASSLITAGIYRFTRNPIYLGDFLLLIGWTVYLSYPLGFLAPILFVLYINRFQIRPEEAAMLDLFGSQFLEYKKRVRRWL